MKIKIEYLNKEELRPYANNAKNHPPEQVEQIKKSIKEFGFNDPIAVWRDNEIIEGHGRLLAAMEMEEIEEVPIIRLEKLTDEQRRAYMIVHNKLTMNTNFDEEILGNELIELLEEIDMSEFGFSDYEISIFTRDLTPSDYDENLLSEHDKYSGSEKVKKRVIITYYEEQLDDLCKFLNIDRPDNRVIYDLSDLLEGKERK